MEKVWDGAFGCGASLCEILRDPSLRESWTACLPEGQDILLTPLAQKSEALAQIESLCAGFVRIERDVTDPAEMESLSLVFYACLLAQWILTNTQVGYQAQSGAVDIEVLYRAGLLSATLGAIEPSLDPKDAQSVRLFFAELAHSVAPETDAQDADAYERNAAQDLRNAEYKTLSAGIHRLFGESGTDSVESTIHSWRKTRDELGMAAANVASAQSYLAAFNLEFGENVSPRDVVQKVRLLNDEVAQMAAERESTRLTWQRMGLEFGVSDPEQIMTQLRTQRDHAFELERELATTQAGQALLRKELGTSDAQEIVAKVQVLNARGDAFSELSSLLGNMDQALTALNS